MVEALARVRPLSGEARIEIIEHLPDETAQALAASSVSIRWSDMAKSEPDALRGIPELYIFRSSPEGWNHLELLLREVVQAGAGNVPFNLKDRLYRCINQQWKDQVFPLGSDGESPRFDDPSRHREARALLRDSTAILLSELEDHARGPGQLSVKETNRMHLPLTWLFVGCPERAVDLLLETILDPDGPVGGKLRTENQYSGWSVHQGVGRAVRNDTQLRVIFDELIGKWEAKGDRQQDKFLLATVSHPMARRAPVRNVLNEDRKRFDRVKGFLDRQLENILEGIHDHRPGDRKAPSLELRYAVMGYRGLCQVRYRNPDWLPMGSDDCRRIHRRMHTAAARVRRQFERTLVERTAPYLIGQGEDPSMPGGF